MKLSIFNASLLFAAVCAGSRTDASVFYSGVQNVSYEQFDSPGAFSLFDAPETWDDIRLGVHVFEDPEFESSYEFYSFLNVQGNFVEFANGNYIGDVERFSGGDSVGASNSWSGNRYMSFSEYRDDGEFAPIVYGEFYNTTGYAGIRLTDGSDVYYGWMQISVTNSNNSAITGTLIDWAYETTPGQAIVIGVIPEPSAAALLFGIAVMVSSVSRRRC